MKQFESTVVRRCNYYHDRAYCASNGCTSKQCVLEEQGVPVPERKVLLSIKPEYAEAILSGKKTIELRKRVWSDWENINTIVLYASSPVRKIVGEVSVESILDLVRYYNLEAYNLTIEDIVYELNEVDILTTCLSRSEYAKYFSCSDTGFAIHLENPVRYETPKDLLHYRLHRPPQNFCYVMEGV